MRAILKRQYEAERKAEAILRAVQPDNLKAPEGIKITSKTDRDAVSITVECEKGLGSFLSTLDDLLSCISAAEGTLEAIE